MRTPLHGLNDQIVAQRQGGTPVREIARTHGVSRQAVYDVLKKAERAGKEIPWQRRVRTPKPCRVCGEAFTPQNPKTKTCSKPCASRLRSLIGMKADSKWSKHQTVTLTCHQCGKSFQRTKYQQSISLQRCSPKKRDFCGRECYGKSVRESARARTEASSQ